MQVIRAGNKAIIWHSLFGNPKIVSGETLEFMDFFLAPRTLNSIFCEFEPDSESEALIGGLIDDYFLVPDNFNERDFLTGRMRERHKEIADGSLIDYLELIVSEDCNFRCKSCIHFNNLETCGRIGDQEKFMSFEMAKKAIDGFIKILRQHGKKEVKVNFGGGEPLLAWPVVERILEYCEATYKDEFAFYFSMNTNASLITAEIAAKLKAHEIKIASSLDGLREGNDVNRITKTGHGTFDFIIKGFDNLASQGYPLDGIAVTINGDNFSFLDERIIDWAAERRMSEVRIDIDVIGMVDISVYEIAEKLMRIRKYAKDRGIEVPGFWSRPAENLNDSTLDARVAFCGATRGNSMCVNPAGIIYGCGYSTTPLGILDRIEHFYASESPYYRFVQGHFTGAMEMCKGCMIEGQCVGGCNITQEFVRVSKTAKMERMCDLYRLMTKLLLMEQLQEIELEN